MQKLFEKLTNSFRKNDGLLSYEAFERIVRSCAVSEESRTLLFILQASGYPISETADGYRLDTFFRSWREELYCVIDIETNGSKPGRSQVIELGAVMIKNAQIIDRFETFVACAYLPEHISRITGIEPSDLIGAPGRKEVLTKLREFMGSAVFTAHNASFDYGFLDASFNRFGLGHIGNPVLCTIELAKRSIESERYGLAYLNEKLDLGMKSHHRAYNDALAASKILLKSFENIPEYVKSTDELLRFAKSNSRERRASRKREARKRI